MKRLIYGFGLLACLLFCLGCSDKDDKNGSAEAENSISPDGAELTLKGQVWIEKWGNGGPVSCSKFTGNSGLKSARDLGGNGEIVAGKLNFVIGVPEYFYDLDDVFQYHIDQIPDFEITPSDAKGAVLDLFKVDNAELSSVFLRSPAKEQADNVYYYYVDRDVIISSAGLTTNAGYSLTIHSFNIPLKKGWNALFAKQRVTISQGGSSRMDVKISLGDPNSLRWTIF